MALETITGSLELWQIQDWFQTSAIHSSGGLKTPNEGKPMKDQRHQGSEKQDPKLSSYEFRKTFQIPIKVRKPQSVTWKDHGRQATVSRAQIPRRVTKQTEGGDEGIPLLIWGCLAGSAKPVMTAVEWIALTAPGS